MTDTDDLLAGIFDEDDEVDQPEPATVRAVTRRELKRFLYEPRKGFESNVEPVRDRLLGRHRRRG